MLSKHFPRANTQLDDDSIIRTVQILPTKGALLLGAFLACLILSPACVGPRGAQPAPLPESTPWNLKKLYAAPSFTWNESAGPVRSLFYEGEPYGGKPTRVFAYYATPQTAGGSAPPKQRLPGVVLVHGGGGTAFREWAQIWAKRGYAAIAMDLTGHQPEEGKDANKPENRIRLADGGPEQGDTELFGNAERDPSEQWPYHAVADVIRAHSLLLSFPEVDPNRTAITGISWGGYLTCIAAGVDHRFKAAVPVYGCGFLHENSAWLDRLNKMSEPQRNRWVRLWDPSRYLPSVSMPILFVNGTNDFAYPLDSYMKSFDAVHGEKQLCVTVNMPHGHQAGWAPKEIGLFIDQYLTKGTPLPKIGDPKVESGRARAPYSGQTKIAKGSLHYTTGGGPINKRDWTTVEARVERSEISAGAPPENVTAWYMSVEDKRGAVVTTRVIFNPPR